MAAGYPGRPTFRRGPIFTGSHNAVTVNQVFNCVEQSWQQARPATGSTKISSNVRMALYSPADFEPRFYQ
ncbi:hypothetical protein BGZ82_008393 [Podila clonocystis]|nr:hypothetical protein BGZ82_008393 [Podila clonocystis]